MTVLGHIFNIIIFISFVGGVFSVLALWAKKVLRIALPLWFGVCGILFYFLPLILPSLYLVPPGEDSWRYGYQIACVIWITGVILFGVYHIIETGLAFHALKKYHICEDEGVNSIYADCIAALKMTKAPSLYVGTFQEPACVVMALRPSVILNESIAGQLTGKELEIVLYHELTHIKQLHHIFRCAFQFAGIIHWFNPFVWIAKNDFALQCEMDCDKKVLSVMNGNVTRIEYASVMLHLMELSSGQCKDSIGGIEAIGFILARQRIIFILNSPSKLRLMISRGIILLLIILTMLLSAYTSRSHFYPYPAYDRGIEYSESEPAAMVCLMIHVHG